MLCTERSSNVAAAAIACKPVYLQESMSIAPQECAVIAPSKAGSNESIFCSDPCGTSARHGTTRLYLEKVLRVVSCPFCNHMFHRDGDAADNLMSITRYVLRFQQRPR
ncbi:hypothetical protein VTP01DRAFT_6348 [Rhizomucor pusillus]|uniref:uncharacterized protein n=1 Tax=Rhizomucor pusillus TaxID=4840 RepID=UPI0037421EDB